jgi:hypothetical protein
MTNNDIRRTAQKSTNWARRTIQTADVNYRVNLKSSDNSY